MKKQISILALAGVAFLLFNSYTNGAPSKVTGSPGDSNFNCTQSGCHDDGTAKQMADMISTDIPATGWEAGKLIMLLSLYQKWEFLNLDFK